MNITDKIYQIKAENINNNYNGFFLICYLIVCNHTNIISLH